MRCDVTTRHHARWLDLHTRAHGRGNSDAIDELALGTRRLRLLNRIGKCPDVFHKFIGRERYLAHTGMDDAGLLDAEFDGATLRGLDGTGNVHSYGADFGVRHHAARAQHFTEPAHQRHQIGRRNATIEINVAAIDSLDQILGPNHIGAGGARLVRFGAAREHRHALNSAGAVRQGNDAADHLVSMPRIDAEIHGDLDGLVKFRIGTVFDHLYRIIEGIEFLTVDPLASLHDPFSMARHCDYSLTSIPIDRAEPSIIRIADSTVSQLRSFIFCSAISLTCALVTMPALSRPGALAPA